MSRTMLSYTAFAFLFPWFGGYLLPLEHMPWWFVNVLAVYLGGTALIAAFGEADRLIIGNLLSYRGEWPKRELDTLRVVAESRTGQACMKFQRSESSPETFDKDVAQHRLACPWFQAATAKINALDADNMPALSLADFHPFPTQVVDPYLKQLRDDIFAYVERYRKEREEVVRLQDRLARSEIEKYAVFLSPFLIATASSLALLSALWAP